MNLETNITEMDFPAAMGNLLILYAEFPPSPNPAHLRREDWAEDEAVFIQYPDEGSKNNQPYFFKVFSKDGRRFRVPWFPTQEDLFADNWMIVYTTEKDQQMEYTDFSHALRRMLRDREKWRISTWHPESFVAAKFPDDESGKKNHYPYLYIRWIDCGEEESEPWTPKDTHIFSNDWEEFNES